MPETQKYTVTMYYKDSDGKVHNSGDKVTLDVAEGRQGVIDGLLQLPTEEGRAKGAKSVTRAVTPDAGK